MDDGSTGVGKIGWNTILYYGAQLSPRKQILISELRSSSTIRNIPYPAGGIHACTVSKTSYI
jgi:hypothetical protein